MSTQRTPPKPSTRLSIPTSPVTSYGSDSQLNLESTFTEHVNRRLKRKLSGAHSPEKLTLINEMKEMFTAFEAQQNSRFEKLLETVNTIKDQNTEFQKCIEFLSSKYDDVMDRLTTVVNQNRNYEHKIAALESKIEQIERNSRATAVEIRNIPIQPLENKTTLRSIVKRVGESIEQPLPDSVIYDVYRIKAKSETKNHIVVNFTTIASKDSFIQQCRNYNKKKTDKKLNTSILQLPGPPKPVFIDESLTSLGRRLAYLARQSVKEHKLYSTWTSYGKIFIRQTAESKPLRIDSEKDLQTLFIK